MFSDPLQVGTELIHAHLIHPEEKAVGVVNKVIVPTLSIVHIQDDLCELIQDNIACMDRLLDECCSAKKDLLFFLVVSDIALCEYTLEKRVYDRSIMRLERKTYQSFVAK